jgi:hypothetical protein
LIERSFNNLSQKSPATPGFFFALISVVYRGYVLRTTYCYVEIFSFGARGFAVSNFAQASAACGNPQLLSSK